MSHIANAIANELKKSKKTAAEIARASGVHEAQISRFISGTQIYVTAEDLIAIANALSASKTEQAKAHARLLHARLLDECSGPGAKFIEILLHDSHAPAALCESPVPYKILPPAMQENLDTIAASITHNRQVRDLIQATADLCRQKSLPQPVSKKTS